MQREKSKLIPKKAEFDQNDVDPSGFEDRIRYYGGFIFVPSIADSICRSGKMKETADAAHCEGTGPK